MTYYKDNYYDIGSIEEVGEFFVFDELYKEKLSYTELINFIVENPEVMRVCRDKAFAFDPRVVFEACLRNPKVKGFSDFFLRSSLMQFAVGRFEANIEEHGNIFAKIYTQSYFKNNGLFDTETDYRKNNKKCSEVIDTTQKIWRCEFRGKHPAVILLFGKNNLESMPIGEEGINEKHVKLIEKKMKEVSLNECDAWNSIVLQSDVVEDFERIAKDVKNSVFEEIMPEIIEWEFKVRLSPERIRAIANCNTVEELIEVTKKEKR